jgi:hypothetical protein
MNSTHTPPHTTTPPSTPPSTPYTWVESSVWDSNNPNLAYNQCLQTSFTPFSAVDQTILTTSPPNATVNVEYTRATVDKSNGVKRYAYWDERPKTVTRSRWFFQEDTAATTGKPDKDNPQPLCREDDDVIEKMYKEGRNEEERIMNWGGIGGYKALWGEGKEGEVRKGRK